MPRTKEHVRDQTGAQGDTEPDEMENGAQIDDGGPDGSSEECKELELIATHPEEDVYEEEEGSEGLSAMWM